MLCYSLEWAADFRRPLCLHHGVIEPNWEEHGALLYTFDVGRLSSWADEYGSWIAWHDHNLPAFPVVLMPDVC